MCAFGILRSRHAESCRRARALRSRTANSDARRRRRASSASGAPFDWPQWQGPDRTGVSKETGLLQQWPRGGPAARLVDVGPGRGLRIARGQGRSHLRPGAERCREHQCSSLNRADGKVVWTKSLGRGGSNDRGPGPRGTPTLDGDRLYVLTENGDLACLNVAERHRGLAAQHPRGFRRPADPLADQRVAARRRRQRHRHPRRPARRHRRARQDDGQDGVGQPAVERRGRLRVADRRRRAGRARHHDADGAGGRRRARVGRQADVAASGGRQRHGERRHADLFRQQGVLHVGLRDRRARCSA